MKYKTYKLLQQHIKLILNLINLFDHVAKSLYYKFIKTTIPFKIFYLFTTITNLIINAEDSFKEKNTIKKALLLTLTLLLAVHQIHGFSIVSKLLYLQDVLIIPVKFLIYQNFHSNSIIQNILIVIFITLFIANITLHLSAIFNIYAININTIEISFISIQVFLQSFNLIYTKTSAEKELSSNETIELMPINNEATLKNTFSCEKDINLENQRVIGKVTPT